MLVREILTKDAEVIRPDASICDAARKMKAAMFDAFRKLGDNPYMGQQRDDLTTQDVRFWPVSRYMVVYDHKVAPVHILRVLDAVWSKRIATISSRLP